MEIHEYQQDGVLVISINGQVDSTTGPVLGEKLEEALATGHLHMVLDLNDVPYMSSAGLRVLSITLKAIRAADANGDLCLANLSKTVAHAFRISGFNQIFSIYETVPQAIAALAASTASS